MARLTVPSNSPHSPAQEIWGKNKSLISKVGLAQSQLWRRNWGQVGIAGDGVPKEGQPCFAWFLHGVYSLVWSSAWKRSLTMVPSSSFLASQRPQGNVMHFPREGASTSTQSTNQPGAFPGERGDTEPIKVLCRDDFPWVTSGTPNILSPSLADT
jgi:hypothetical protein